MMHACTMSSGGRPRALLLLPLLALGPMYGCTERNASHAAGVEPARGESAYLDFIKIEPVVESDSATMVSLTGRVTFDEDHTQRLASPIDGRATALLVRPGDKVHAGQPLIELSSPHVGEMQADSQKAAQDLTIAQKALDRARRLRGDGAISDKEVAQAEGDYKKARADVARTAAQLKSLGLSASDPTVKIALRSQIAGSVVERNILVGQEVRADAAAPLLTLSSLETVWVQADVYEQDLGLVEEGASVVVRVPAYPGEGFPGTVGHIGDVVDPTTRTVKIRCVVPNPSGRLKPEMFAKIDLKNAGGHKIIMIPSRAVISDGEKAKVIVSGDKGAFTVRIAEVGPEVDGRVRVIDGLKAGEKIVTDGAIFLMQELTSR